MDLQDDIALVTGAASEFGAEVAIALGAAGASVAIIDEAEDGLDFTAGRVAAAGGRCAPIRADITRTVDVQAAVRAVQQQWGPIGVLVNAGATSSAVGPAWRCEANDWFRDLRTGLYGAFLCCRAVGEGMIERGRGTILNVLDPVAVSAAAVECTARAAAMAGLLRFSEALAADAAAHNVRVLTIEAPAGDDLDALEAIARKAVTLLADIRPSSLSA